MEETPSVPSLLSVFVTKGCWILSSEGSMWVSPLSVDVLHSLSRFESTQHCWENPPAREQPLRAVGSFPGLG